MNLQNPQQSLSNLFGKKMFTNTQNLNNEGIPKSEIVKYTPDYAEM